MTFSENRFPLFRIMLQRERFRLRSQAGFDALVDVRNKQLRVFFQQQPIPYQLLRSLRNRGRTVAIVRVALGYREARIVVLLPPSSGETAMVACAMIRS
jgi:hypothetical protein